MALDKMLLLWMHGRQHLMSSCSMEHTWILLIIYDFAVLKSALVDKDALAESC